MRGWPSGYDTGSPASSLRDQPKASLLLNFITGFSENEQPSLFSHLPFDFNPLGSNWKLNEAELLFDLSQDGWINGSWILWWEKGSEVIKGGTHDKFAWLLDLPCAWPESQHHLPQPCKNVCSNFSPAIFIVPTWPFLSIGQVRAPLTLTLDEGHPATAPHELWLHSSSLCG